MLVSHVGVNASEGVREQLGRSLSIMFKKTMLAVAAACLVGLAMPSEAKADHCRHGGYGGGYHHGPSFYGGGYGYGRPAFYPRPYYRAPLYGGYGGYGGYGRGASFYYGRGGFGGSRGGLWIGF